MAFTRVLWAQLVLAACEAFIWPRPCSEASQPSLLLPSCPSAILPGDATFLGILSHPSCRLPTGPGRQHVVSALLSTLIIEWAGQVLTCADPSRFPWENLELASIKVFSGPAELQG